MFLKKNKTIISLIFLFSGCSSTKFFSQSKNAQAAVASSPFDDEEYAPILSAWQRDVTLYKDFMMAFSGTATLMSSEMIDAYKKRLIKLQGAGVKLDPNIIPKERNTVSVVISAYSPFGKLSDFTDNKVWNSVLRYNNQWIHPSNVVYYRNSSSFLPFFSVGYVWSKMIVMQFRVPNFVDSPLNSSSKFEANAEHPILFSMISGPMTVDYAWR